MTQSIGRNGIPCIEDDAFIVHITPIGDRDGMVRVLTRLCGRITVFSRGVRSASSSLRLHMRSLSRGRIQYHVRSQSDYVHLHSFEAVESYQRFSIDPRLMGRASYLLEWAEQFSQPGMDANEVFQLLEDALQCLDGSDRDRWVLRAFELKLLSQSGLGIDWSAEKLQSPLALYLLVENGSFTQTAAADRIELSMQTRRLAQYLSETPFASIVMYAPESIATVSLIFRAYARFHGWKMPRSAAFLQKLHRAQETFVQ